MLTKDYAMLPFQICHDENQPPIGLRCPTNKPYCLNGKCGTVNGNCMTNSNPNGFTCTSNGTFPGKLLLIPKNIYPTK